MSLLVRLFATFGILVHTITSAQTLNLEWNYSFPYRISGQMSNGTPDNHGGYYLLGNHVDSLCFIGSAVLCKISEQGSPVWIKSIFNDTDCIAESLGSLTLMGEELIISGQRSEGWVFKLDSAGSFHWESDSALTFMLHSISADDHVIVLSPPGALIYAYDTSGNYIWDAECDGLFSPQAIKIISLGNGLNYVYCNAQDTAGGETAAVALHVVDNSGNLIFDTLLNHQTNADPDLAIDICANQYDEVFMLSRDQTTSGIFIHKYNFQQHASVFQSYIAPVNCIPQRMVVDTANQYIYADARCADGFRIIKYDYQLNPLDTLVMDTSVASETMGVSATGLLYVAYQPAGYYELFTVLVFDPVGICIETFNVQSNGMNHIPRLLQFDTLGNVFVSGTSVNPLGDDFGFVFKFNSTVNVSEHERTLTQISIFPNPTGSIVTVDYSDPQPVRMNIIDISGQICSSSIIRGGRYSFATESFASGVYFIEIISSGGQRSVQKLIIQHQ